MQGVRRTVGVHGARGRHERLPQHLPAENTAAAEITRLAPEQIVFQVFEIQKVEKILQYGSHGAEL